MDRATCILSWSMSQKKPNKRRRTVTDDEKTLWEVFTRDVKPLRKKKRKGAGRAQENQT